MSEHVRVEDRDRIRVLRLARPEKKNALTSAMYEALTTALRTAGSDPEIRVVLIGGGADFTAGNDLADFLAADRCETPPALAFLQALADFEKPVLACVCGFAVGIGTTMLLHCDGVIAGRSARFQLPFAQLGLVPEAGSSLLLPELAGRLRASWWLLTGEAFGAEEAAIAGLVSRVVEDQAAEPDALAVACKIAAAPPAAIRETKRLVRQGLRAGVAAAIERENAAFRQRLRSAEAKEAFSAFLEKRPPDFSRF